jgi:hypothetical protein
MLGNKLFPRVGFKHNWNLRARMIRHGNCHIVGGWGYKTPSVCKLKPQTEPYAVWHPKEVFNRA